MRKCHKKNKSIEEEINEFLEIWNCKKICDFIRDIYPIFELYNVDESDDWVRDVVGESNERNVRLIRTVYLMSRIAEYHGGTLNLLNTKHKKLWERLEKHNENK